MCANSNVLRIGLRHDEQDQRAEHDMVTTHIRSRFPTAGPVRAKLTSDTAS
jgi:hypothetical protein